MFITLSREDARARLIAAGYRYVETVEFTSEVWARGDGSEIYLHPELDGTGRYEEEAIKAAERLA